MSTLQQLREGMTHAWDQVVDGWEHLFRRASGALTRFTSHAPEGKSQELLMRGSGWGLLAAEVFDDDNRVVVRLEAPGMEKSDFDLQVIGDDLAVRGEKHVGRERTEGRYQVTECAYARFERAIPLPDEVDRERASARYNQGVLRVELPKVVPKRPRSRKIDVS